MEITFYEKTPEDCVLEFVVILVKTKDEWILSRHRERATWEFAGGHIENNESPDEAASRELYEETGAEEFLLYPVTVYSFNQNGGAESFGRLYLATIQKFGELPPYEMAEIKGFQEVPENVTYPSIYPFLLSKVKEYINQSGVIS